jgi:hypothetical protein
LQAVAVPPNNFAQSTVSATPLKHDEATPASHVAVRVGVHPASPSAAHATHWDVDSVGKPPHRPAPLPEHSTAV